MNEKLLHTPEGVRDIYNSECQKKIKITEQIHKTLESYSYHDIDTPTFEYFDIFNMNMGSAPSNEMYKFFDRNNNTLVLRPDITPSIARSVAKYYADCTLPIRLCYKGNTFINAHQHQGKLSEFTQIGGELINDDSSAADAEIIACVISCLLATGLKEFQIEIGDVSFFKGLSLEAGLDEETENKIRDYIQIKNFFGLSEFVSKLDINTGIKEVLTNFDNMFGDVSMLKKAGELVTNTMSLDALDRMNKIYNALCAYGYEQYVGFDLSMLNGYNYYTGIVFRGYTYGTGDAVVKGGRYNTLLSKFGKDAPSVGFAIYVDDLMNALSRNKIEVETDHSNILMLYDRENQRAAIVTATRMRNNGMKVELVRQSAKREVADYIDYCRKMQYPVLIKIDDDENATKVNVADNTSCTVSIAGL